MATKRSTETFLNPPESGRDNHIRYWFKSCPKCVNGDVIRSDDFHGWYLKCLHCGYMKDLDAPAQAESVLESERQRWQPPAVAA